MLRGKDRKKRKTRYAKLNRSRLKRLTARGKEGNKGINVEKIIIGLKIKIKKKERRKKGQLYKTAKAQHRGRGL